MEFQFFIHLSFVVSRPFSIFRRQLSVIPYRVSRIEHLILAPFTLYSVCRGENVDAKIQKISKLLTG